jgi:hypothetical protein
MFPTNSDNRYFSLDGYRALVTRARTEGYRITTFANFAPPSNAPVLLLRHDLDGPLRGAREMAELEATLGISATYFVQTAGDFYNLLSKSSRAFVRQLVALGHEVGLHYEASRYLEVGERALRADLRLLEDLAGRRILSASQHLPVDADAVDVARHVANEAYAPRFTAPPLTYISDSLMAWREATPHDLIDRRASFQLLTHPETWCGPYASMGDALDGMMDEEQRELRARYDDIRAYYLELLATRAERDRRFRERQAQPPRALASPTDD